MAVMGASLLLTVIGLAAIATARIETRKRQVINATTLARNLAESGIDLALLAVKKDTNFRTTYTHDQWEPDQAFDGGTIRWKLLDGADDASSDGDLNDDPMDSCRIVAWSLSGGAIQKCSIVVQPVSVVSGPNLLPNPGVETGMSPWQGNGSSIAIVTSDFHTGSQCLHVSGRDKNSSGGHQDVVGTIENGKTYEVEVWVKKTTTVMDMFIEFHTDSTGSLHVDFEGPPITLGTDWTKVTANLTPTWNGTLTKGNWRIRTVSSKDDFLFDDASMKAVTTQMHIAPGSWQRVVD